MTSHFKGEKKENTHILASFKQPKQSQTAFLCTKKLLSGSKLKGTPKVKKEMQGTKAQKKCKAHIVSSCLTIRRAIYRSNKVIIGWKPQLAATLL